MVDTTENDVWRKMVRLLDYVENIHFVLLLTKRAVIFYAYIPTKHF